MPKIRMYEKTSPRSDQLRRSDKLVNQDIMDHFWKSINQVCQNLQFSDKLQISNCLDKEQKALFENLVNGVSPRYEKYKRDQLKC